MKMKDSYLTRRRGERGVKTMKAVFIPCHSACLVVNGRLSGVLCWPHGQQTKNRPAQRDSGITNLAGARWE